MCVCVGVGVWGKEQVRSVHECVMCVSVYVMCECVSRVHHA